MPWLVEIALVNAVLATLLAAVALLAQRYSGRPALAHALWVLVLVKLVTPPLLPVEVEWDVPLLPWVVADPLGAESEALVSEVAPKGEPNHARSAQSATTSSSRAEADAAGTSPLLATIWENLRDGRLWARGAIALWLIGAVVWFGLQFSRILRFNRLLRRTDLAPADVQAQNRTTARAMGLRRCPLVRLVPGTFSPMLWAFGARAQLLFPADLLARLDVASRGTLLAHELAHYRRRDHWVHLLQLVVTGLFWWHPAVWWARRGIEAAEEECCDAWVVSHFPEAPRRYAEALLETVDFLAGARPFVAPTASGLGDVPLLRQRLTRIMRGGAPRTLTFVGRCAVLAVVVLLPLRPVRALPTAVPAAEVPRTDESTASKPTPRPSANPHRRSTRPRMGSRVALPSRPIRTETPRPAAPWPSAASPDGRWTVSTGRGGRVALRDEQSGRELDLTEFGILTIAFTPDGHTFLSGGSDGAVRLWDCPTGRPLAILGTHDESVKAVAVAADGQSAASGSRDGVVKLWRLSDLSQIDEFPQDRLAVGSVAFSPDGRSLAISSGHWMSVRPGTVRVLELPTRDLLLSVEAPSPVGAIAFHPNGEWLVVAEWSGRIAWRDLRSGLEIAETTVEKDRVSSAAFSPDGGLPVDPPEPDPALPAYASPSEADWLLLPGPDSSSAAIAPDSAASGLPVPWDE